MTKRHWCLIVAMTVLSPLFASASVRPAQAQNPAAASEAGEELSDEFEVGELLSGIDRAASADPAFARYIDFVLLGQALSDGDAPLLADVALSTAEGERVLFRSHAGGLSSDQLMLRAARLAGRHQDKATLDRLAAGGSALGKADWADKVSGIARLSESSRAVVGTIDLDKLDEKSRNVVGMLEIAVQAAELTGARDPLLALQRAVATADVSPDVKKLVDASVKATLDSLPEPNAEVDDLLQELSAGSRGFKIGGVTVSPPKLPSVPTPKLPTPRYETNKFDLKARVESGGWVVAWSDDITETDVGKGVVAAGVSIYSGNPAVFIEWVNRLVDRTVSSLMSSARRRFTTAILKNVKTATVDVMKAAVQGKSAKEVARRYDTVDFKAGAIRYSGANMVGSTVISRTWGLKLYVAFRIR